MFDAHRPEPKRISRRGRTLGGVIILLIVAALAPGAVLAADPPGPIHDGIFLSLCRFSHTASDDPIVHPGDAGASHQHEFFGNTTTNASSTYRTLRAGSTTCRIAADTAAYWVPSVLTNGERVAPIRVNAYYLRGRGMGRVVAFPAGLKVVAGDGEATAPQSTAMTGWKCAGSGATLSVDPVACPTGRDNVLVIRFPDCWNGKDLDSANHKSHMAYRVNGRCPTGYPVRVPRLSLNVHYRLPTIEGLTLSSGSIYSSHADFFNAWNQAALTRLVRLNLN